jgi:hypothetical protein
MRCDLEYQKLYWVTAYHNTERRPRCRHARNAILLTPVNTPPGPNTSQGLPRVYLEVEHGTEVDSSFDSAGQGQSCAF